MENKVYFLIENIRQGVNTEIFLTEQHFFNIKPYLNNDPQMISLLLKNDHFILEDSVNG